MTVYRDNQRDVAAERARVARFDACDHSWFDLRATFPEHLASKVDARCFGYDVATDVQYIVQGCRGCEARRDLDRETGEALRVYFADSFPQGVHLQDATEPDVYIPEHDGIDAATDNREPMFTNLFDARGGKGGIGD